MIKQVKFVISTWIGLVTVSFELFSPGIYSVYINGVDIKDSVSEPTMMMADMFMRNFIGGLYADVFIS